MPVCWRTYSVSVSYDLVRLDAVERHVDRRPRACPDPRAFPRRPGWPRRCSGSASWRHRVASLRSLVTFTFTRRAPASSTAESCAPCSTAFFVNPNPSRASAGTASGGCDQHRNEMSFHGRKNRTFSGRRSQPQHQRDRAEERPQHDPRDVRRLEPVPARQRERPEAVDQQEHAAMAGVVLDAGGDARAEDRAWGRSREGG